MGIFQPTLPMSWTYTPSCPPTPTMFHLQTCDQRCQVEVEVTGQEASL